MKVKITQCNNQSSWYADKIGQEFEVEDSYRITDKLWYIDKSDCIPVEDDIHETVMIEVTDMFHHCFRRKFKAVPSKDIYKCTEYNFVFRKDQCREVTPKVEDDEVQAVMIEVTWEGSKQFGKRFQAVEIDGEYKVVDHPFTFAKEHCKVVGPQRTPIGWRLDIDVPEWELTAGTESMIRGKDDIFTFYDKDDCATYLPISILPHIATPIYDPQPDENGWWKFEEKRPEYGDFIWDDNYQFPYVYDSDYEGTFTKWQPCVKPPM